MCLIKDHILFFSIFHNYNSQGMSRLYSYFLFLHVGDALKAILHSIQYLMPLVYHNASFGRHFFRMKWVKICKRMKKHLRVNHIIERALRFLTKKLPLHGLVAGDRPGATVQDVSFGNNFGKNIVCAEKCQNYND